MSDTSNEPFGQALRALNTLDELCAPERVSARGTPEFTFDLPMPGISYLELVP